MPSKLMIGSVRVIHAFIVHITYLRERQREKEREKRAAASVSAI